MHIESTVNSNEEEEEEEEETKFWASPFEGRSSNVFTKDWLFIHFEYSHCGKIKYYQLDGVRDHWRRRVRQLGSVQSGRRRTRCPRA